MPVQAPLSGVTKVPGVLPIVPGKESPLAGLAVDGGLPLNDEEALGIPVTELEVPVGLLNSGTLTSGGGAPNEPLGPSTVFGEPGTLRGEPVTPGTFAPGAFKVLPGTPPKPAPTGGELLAWIPAAEVPTPAPTPSVLLLAPGPANDPAPFV